MNRCTTVLILPILLTLLPILAHSQVDTVKTFFEKGVLKDGYKVGVWEYYDAPGILALKVDYNSAKLLFLKEDTSAYPIRSGNEWINSRLDVYPRYIGSMNEFYDILSTETLGKYLLQARGKRTVGTFYVLFQVDSLGSAGGFEVINDIGDGCSDIILEAMKKIPNYWLPARKGAYSYTSRFILPVHFKIIEDGREVKSKKKDKTAIDLPLAKELPEFVVTATARNREHRTVK